MIPSGLDYHAACGDARLGHLPLRRAYARKGGGGSWPKRPVAVRNARLEII